MSNTRNIKEIIRGKATVDGAGVSLVRVLGHRTTQAFDPFLMLDSFDSNNPADYIAGFPMHPHRGIETITYLVSGDIEHEDSLGNKGSILDGDCQWMTAGSGILHQEMPQRSPRMLGVQLWLNMPAELKMSPPQYGDINSRNIPVIYEDNVEIRIISGKYKGHKGAFEGKYVKATYLDIDIPANAQWEYTCAPNTTLFVFTLLGEGKFGSLNSDTVPEKSAVLFDSGDLFHAQAGDRGLRLLLLEALPLREPIAWGGPIVMNSQEELRQAFSDLETGKFIRHRL